MNYRVLIISISLLFSCHHANTDPVISFFMRHYPEQQAIMSLVKKPWKRTSQMHHYFDLQPFVGIYSTYGGMIQVSDMHGETTFPRKHNNNLIYLVITTEIIPIIMFHNTIHHWELNKKVPATVYQIEQKKDPESNILFWEVSIGSLPVNNILPLESIVIFAKPTNIYLPVGVSPSTESAHLLLPDIYVKKGINVVENTLYINTLNMFFKKVTTKEEKKTKQYSFKVY